MTRQKHKFPPFIDPKTGKRYANYLNPVPGTGKPITELSVDEFISALDYIRNSDELRHYFYQVGWPEGYVYCQDEGYARHTGYVCLRNVCIMRNSPLLVNGERKA
jgi:hypothetical protein